MKKIYKYPALVLGALLAGACTYDFPAEVEPTTGDADFKKTIAIGSSLTAGFMNGALYDAGQSRSFAAIVAEQMALVGGEEFNQPDINATDGYYGVATGIPGVPDGTILGRLYLKGTTSPSPTPKIPGQAIGAFAGDKAALNNFSAYGVSIQTAQLPALGGPPSANPYFNPYYARFASVPGTSTLLSDAADALENGGTFFIFWLGIDDVLGYSTNGAAEADLSKPLTSVGAFTVAYNAALETMLAANGEAMGVVANIPDITSLPYFSLVAYNAIPLDAPNAAGLNAGYASFNGGIDAYNAGLLPGQPGVPPDNLKRPKINFAAGPNAIVIADQTLPDLTAYGIPTIRQATTADMIALSAGAILGKDLGNGPKGLQDPLEDKYVILPGEKADIQEHIDDFNEIIAGAVADHSDRLALVDVNTILKNLKTSGAEIGGATLTASISPPFGGFSLDGVHPNARGNGYLANKFIDVINAKFKSDIPHCNPNNFSGNELPVP